MRKKIVTINFSIPTNAAANVSQIFAKKLNSITEFKKCRGFGLAINSSGGAGVTVEASLSPISGRPLIDPVSLEFLKVDPQTPPDARLHTVEFDVTNDDVEVTITPRALTTAAITGQAIFLLTNE